MNGPEEGENLVQNPDPKNVCLRMLGMKKNERMIFFLFLPLHFLLQFSITFLYITFFYILLFCVFHSFFFHCNRFYPMRNSHYTPINKQRRLGKADYERMKDLQWYKNSDFMERYKCCSSRRIFLSLSLSLRSSYY